MSATLNLLDTFARRHIGPSTQEISSMLETLGVDTLDALIDEVVPASIRAQSPLILDAPLTESELLEKLQVMAAENKMYRSFIGMGYYDTLTPSVILRNILENPGWYTQYTPYQAEISQGRLEALLNFQTMVIDLTGFEVANASLLDEATACAEAMNMFHNLTRNKNTFLVSDTCHPQNIELIQTRALPLGIRVVVSSVEDFEFSEDVFGVLLQYPDTNGSIENYEAICQAAHDAGAYVAVATDLLALALLKPPAEFGADVAVGNSQRFGVPLGYGGPHAAFFATHEKFSRKMPGRIIGVSKDAQGNPALRMALQTREQHIRRDKATSNICTAQVLLAIISSMYAVYHGPDGIKAIANRTHALAKVLALGLSQKGFTVLTENFFDTLRIQATPKTEILKANCEAHHVNLRWFENGDIGISVDETTTTSDINTLLSVFDIKEQNGISASSLAQQVEEGYTGKMERTSAYLTHPVFNSYHSETEMLRYIFKLQQRDLSLTQSMIALGSCTMKLNATTEMIPITWAQFAKLHPFAPIEQAKGYHVLFDELSSWLKEITGFDAVSLQPNSGAQGEYAGLLVIRAYHHHHGDDHRNICLIPSSAHGTNPASAVLAGMKVVVVACDEHGNIDVEDLRTKASQHQEHLAALMVTYPSTHGVFEASIHEICEIVHTHGGQVYMDGANMNAQVGLTNPGIIGADVCHLNLHKTFCIPHGGGGPGMGPIAVASHLAPFLPQHSVIPTGGAEGTTAVSAAPFGSASILPISWAYIAMMGGQGLTESTKVAILNANYMANKLSAYFPVLYTGENGRCAHEFILDLRPSKRDTGISEEDVAKRLMDYGFHAPTMSFPVAGTIMIEPTESENKAEMDRFCEALIAIHEEIDQVRKGTFTTEESVLHHAPHTASVVTNDSWERKYTRQHAAFPLSWVKENKFWPYVGRIDNAYGDRNLVCACLPLEAYADEV